MSNERDWRERARPSGTSFSEQLKRAERTRKQKRPISEEAFPIGPKTNMSPREYRECLRALAGCHEILEAQEGKRRRRRKSRRKP